MARRCRSRDRCNGNKKGRKGRSMRNEQSLTRSSNSQSVKKRDEETSRAIQHICTYVCVCVCLATILLGQRHPAQSRGRLILLHIMQIPVCLLFALSSSTARARFTLYLLGPLLSSRYLAARTADRAPFCTTQRSQTFD